MKSNCEDIRELMPDLAAGLGEPGSEVKTHLQSCAACSAKLEDFRRTMALLDEWKAPEPSPYFDTRFQAKLREEMSKQQQSQGWFQWLRRPAFAVSLMICMVVGVTVIQTGPGHGDQPSTVEVGTAVSDLQTLDKNTAIYNDFDLLDDLQVQPNVAANQ